MLETEVAEARSSWLTCV